MSWLLKALPYVIAVVLFGAWTGLTYHIASKASGDAVRLEWQAERANNARAAVDAFTRTLDAQWQMTESLAARDAAHAKEIERVQGEKALLKRQLSTGAVRVSVPVRTTTCPAGGNTGAAAAGQPAEARAELDPAFAADVAGITGEGDEAIYDLNACIDRYNEVRDRINALTRHGTTSAQSP
ncbi:lysis system i-spanin subunit Rz [Variovorax sp. EL159]|uniref:lysis system i-spanin subunit Rz n=1 Tax=Variovorax sp. EL159 TaxID=1566270 RepID=UPI0008819D5D|nr:lysis system i-spanin subunit Rz [Variovorax sp. EL159]SCX53129.1 Bacteriophage Rz lysis protein [Variovorax sp. EL159]